MATKGRNNMNEGRQKNKNNTLNYLTIIKCMLEVRMKVNSSLLSHQFHVVRVRITESTKKCVPSGNIDFNLCTKFKRKR